MDKVVTLSHFFEQNGNPIVIQVSNHSNLTALNIYKEVNWLFFFCSILVAGGELHRVFSNGSESVQTEKAITKVKINTYHNSLSFPVPGHSRKHLIGLFGEPRGKNRKHEGVDIAAKRGTPVVAVVDGIVTKVKEGGNGGRQVWMKDKNRDWTYYYAHLHSQSVVVGQEVEQGEELGTVGNTGNASSGSPHLHFSIYEPEMQALDPLTVLP